MTNTTFTGPVRSENGFEVINVNATTGTATNTFDVASTGIVTNKFVKHVGFATGVTVNTTAGDSDNIGEELVILATKLELLVLVLKLLRHRQMKY